MVEAGRDVRMSSGLPPGPSKQGRLEAVAQDHVQVALEYLQKRRQGGRLHSLSGQPVPVLGHPHSKEVIPDVQREPAVFRFVPTASFHIPGHP